MWGSMWGSTRPGFPGFPGFSIDIPSPWKPVMPRQAGTFSHMDLQQGICSVGQAPSPGRSSLDGKGR